MTLKAVVFSNKVLGYVFFKDGVSKKHRLLIFVFCVVLYTAFQGGPRKSGLS